jgi:four helix bundle protein
MAKIDRFEDFIAWQKARALTATIYKITNEGTFSRDYSLRDQIRRASSSIMANIAEGFERGGHSEFEHFLSIAKASCAELRSHLYIALDAGHLRELEFNKLLRNAEEVGQIITHHSSLITHYSLITSLPVGALLQDDTRSPRLP